jgi:hypothetical protein
MVQELSVKDVWIRAHKEGYITKEKLDEFLTRHEKGLQELREVHNKWIARQKEILNEE